MVWPVQSSRPHSQLLGINCLTDPLSDFIKKEEIIAKNPHKYVLFNPLYTIVAPSGAESIPDSLYGRFLAFVMYLVVLVMARLTTNLNQK